MRNLLSIPSYVPPGGWSTPGTWSSRCSLNVGDYLCGKVVEGILLRNVVFQSEHLGQVNDAIIGLIGARL